MENQPQQTPNTDRILAIGSHFTDEQGNNQVPIYTKNPSTGLMSTTLVTIGKDTNTIEKNKNLENDVAFALKDIQDNENDPEAIAHYKTELQKQYGDMAVQKLDSALGTIS